MRFNQYWQYQLWQAMKISITQLFLFVLCGSLVKAYPGTAQGLLDRTLSLEVKSEKLENVLSSIEKRTGVEFVYSPQLIAINEKVSVNAQNKKLAQVLHSLFDGRHIQWRVVGTQIVLRNNRSKSLDPNPLKKGNEHVPEIDRTIKGQVTDESTGETLPGVTIRLKGSTLGTTTDGDGNFQLDIPDQDAFLVFSFVGYVSQEIAIGNQSTIHLSLQLDEKALDELIVVGYGTQKKSDVTGTVSVIPKNRMEALPNISIAQALQAAAPGINIQNSSAGAEPAFNIMIRGRNSIKASNQPLIVLDGVPYNGPLSDLNPNDVESIEVLKDASSAAIYGSRGANGVILVTTKTGRDGRARITYDGKFSFQSYTNVPPVMNGEEFFQYKTVRYKEMITLFEQQRYEAGEWSDWVNIALRDGFVQDHNMAISGASKGTNYYVSGGYLNAKGLAINDRYERLVGRINVTSKLHDWVEIGTRTQYSYGDRSGVSPGWGSIYTINPLTRAFDENGNLSVYPWDNDPYFGNPLSQTLYDNVDESFQLVTNNFVAIKLPFIKGLNYRLNTGVSLEVDENSTYMGRNTKEGLAVRGNATQNRFMKRNTAIENILSYQAAIDRHSVFATAVYSYESRKNEGNSLQASGFPNDYLTWYSMSQAELVVPSASYSKTALISQMLRLNYSFDSRYLLTLTARRDGYSGFGLRNKWGVFPSLAAGWNIANEDFFPFKTVFSSLKLRGSWGKNGNQAVDAYESISRLSPYDMVSGSETLPGYFPSVLGQESLGWETSQTFNFGLDVGILSNRINGEVNLFRTRTIDLLLDRSISAIHGIANITQNIGKTENNGFELAVNSKNIHSPVFKWETSANITTLKNKIISLYGYVDDNGNEVNDIENQWFIGKPIRVNYDYVREGTWQLNEAEEAAKWGSKPGWLKLKDVDGNYKIDANDRQIIGQQDPKWMWGMSNTFSYKNFTLSAFLHGVHGVTKNNTLMRETGDVEVRTNTIKLNWWTPDNPTNEWVANHRDANRMGGFSAAYYEDASFIRLKDVTLMYRLPENLNRRFKSEKVQFFITGRNLYTKRSWKGLDPELSSQTSTPLQKEYVLGISLQF